MLTAWYYLHCWRSFQPGPILGTWGTRGLSQIKHCCVGWHWGTALNLGVFAALFTQKSDNNSSVRILLLLALACFGVYSLIMALFCFHYDGRIHTHGLRWLAEKSYSSFFLTLVGLVALTTPVLQIDRPSIDPLPPPENGTGSAKTDPRDTESPEAAEWPRESVIDSDALGIRGLQVAKNSKYNRVSIIVVNRKASVTLFNSLSFEVVHRGPVLCEGAETISYQLDPAMTVSDGRILGTVTGLRGPLAGFKVAVRGWYSQFCSDDTFGLEFDSAVSIGPHESLTLTLDIPRIARISGSASATVDAETEATPTVVTVALCFALPIELTFIVSYSGSEDSFTSISQDYADSPSLPPSGTVIPFACD